MTTPFWDERYNTNDYVYGKEPNTYFRKFVDRHPPCKLLLPGEGEGRNAVYAAIKGWEVTAFDQSQVARMKALKLAGEKKTSFDYLIGTLDDLNFANNSFDYIALIFFHLPEADRLQTHRKLIQLLKDGGKILVEVFHKDQLGKTSGGPKDITMLYDRTTLTEDFSALNILEMNKLTTALDEGEYHQGEASLIRMIAQKA